MYRNVFVLLWCKIEHLLVSKWTLLIPCKFYALYGDSINMILIKCSVRFAGIGIPIIKIRRSHDRLIFIIAIPMPTTKFYKLQQTQVLAVVQNPLHGPNSLGLPSKYVVRRKHNTHDDVIKCVHFARCWLLGRDFIGDRWIPLTKPVTLKFDVFFYLRLDKRLSKQSRRRWFETPSRSLWGHCNETSQQYQGPHIDLLLVEIPIKKSYLYDRSPYTDYTLQWRHNGRDSVSNHQPHDCLFRRRWKKTS